ncbi:MAG: ethanolamine ammonia-lyase reactivating factor EutA [Promethearchaeota archaeon]
MTRYAEVQLDIESLKFGVSGIVSKFFEKSSSRESTALIGSFISNYYSALEKYEEEDTNDFLKLRRLITEFKPALSSVLQPGEEFDGLCESVIPLFNVMLDSAKQQIMGESSQSKTKGPMIPGSDQSTDIRYYCTVCKQKFDISQKVKIQLLNSVENVEIPKHHGKEMKIMIVRLEDTTPLQDDNISVDTKLDESKFSAAVLMGHFPSLESNVEYLKLLSVGIDVGSSTSHLVFSKITLKREQSFFNPSNRFFPINRELIYEGRIIFTPLSSSNTIDIESVVNFIHEEYKKANIKPNMVDTGAVIVTGEAARKQNAAEIVNLISSETGKFVSATAGPNFEALLGAIGSGIVKYSQIILHTIMNVDVGGGSCKLSIISNGYIHSTAGIRVGGRLLGIDKKFKIWRIDEPSYFLMEELKMNYQLGDIISEKDVRIIAKKYAEILLEVMRGPAKSNIAKKLMLTDNLDFTIPIDEYSFSGGVAEMIYGSLKEYNDIGNYLAQEIQNLMNSLNLPIVEPDNKIRATVIGAGAFTLSISGSTCFVDENIKLPVFNVPVIPVNVTYENFSTQKVEEEVSRSFKNFDFEEGEDLVALYFTRPILSSSERLLIFAKALETALPNSAANKKMIILLFGMDIARILATIIRRETSIKTNLICLDELVLKVGDWIDIGAPLHNGEAYPVTIKSLIFKR